jgi:hypothetical protein
MAEGESGAPRNSLLPQLRMDELLDELISRMTQIRATRDRVQQLLQGVLAVSGGLELDQVLSTIIETATELVAARYGALGVIDSGGEHLERFVTVGLGQPEIEAIGPYPTGMGLLGELIRHPEPLRMADIAEHESSFGAGRGRGRGDRQRADVRRGAAAAAADGGHGRAHARAAFRRRLAGRARGAGRAGAGHGGRGAGAGDASGRLGRELGGPRRRRSWRRADPRRLGTDGRLGGRRGVPGGAGRAVVGGEREPEPVWKELGLGPAYIAPLGTVGKVRGVLVAAKRYGALPFDAPVMRMLTEIGGQAAIALDWPTAALTPTCWPCSPTATASAATCTIWRSSGCSRPG